MVKKNLKKDEIYIKIILYRNKREIFAGVKNEIVLYQV